MEALILAAYIVKNYDNISPMKLQKLLYYVKAWGIVSGENLLDAAFEKWTYGPVNSVVYQAFKSYANQFIPQSMVEKANLPKENKKTIDFILDCYASYTAVTLSAMTHEDEPWKKTSVNKVISDKSIKLYYSKLPFANNFPFNPKNPFYPVQTDLHYAYIFDMTKKDADSLSVYPSFNAYQQQVGKANKDFQKLLKKLA
jgi:uncharacterized phage-associated protein